MPAAVPGSAVKTTRRDGVPGAAAMSATAAMSAARGKRDFRFGQHQARRHCQQAPCYSMSMVHKEPPSSS
jgi:hypothetical protein